MRADQIVPAVVAAVAVVCLLIAGRADGQDEYVPAGAASQEVETLATNQNPRQILPQPELMPVPNNLLPRPGAALSGQQPTTEQEPETEAEPQPEQTITREPEPVTPTQDQGDFYRTGATPTTPEPPATPTSPETWETPRATPSVPVQQGYP
ncbi:hypothetical protein CFC21_069544 [Triticum aestivum]|uniref:Uncharacterized protein n=2 Tax=Triticum aestivum TaxID=4565 RepID=A0A3B6LF61_WHEAT|nr:hypothetical protein CFC21_069544 [Triticum aestivum]